MAVQEGDVYHQEMIRPPAHEPLPDHRSGLRYEIKIRVWIALLEISALAAAILRLFSEPGRFGNPSI